MSYSEHKELEDVHLSTSWVLAEVEVCFMVLFQMSLEMQVRDLF